MKGFYKLSMFLGAAASVLSAFILMTLVSKIMNPPEEEQEIEEDDDRGLVDVENSPFNPK